MPKFRAPAPPYLGPAAHTSPGDNKPINRIVIHSTVSPCKAGGAEDIARYFRSKASGGSAHYVVDPGTVVQVVYDSKIAWHAPPNPHSLGIEMCDMPVLNSKAHWWMPKAQRTGAKPIVHGKRVRPLRWIEPQHRAMMKRTAKLVARLCLAYGIPIRTLTDAELRAWDKAGRKAALGGIVTHAQMSRVFKKSTHWDPGEWPSALFMRRVRKAAAKLEAEK